MEELLTAKLQTKQWSNVVQHCIFAVISAIKPNVDRYTNEHDDDSFEV